MANKYPLLAIGYQLTESDYRLSKNAFLFHIDKELEKIKRELYRVAAGYYDEAQYRKYKPLEEEEE